MGTTIQAESRAMPKPTSVLKHGAFAASASWNGVLRRLQDRGYTAVAATFPNRPHRRRAS